MNRTPEISMNDRAHLGILTVSLGLSLMGTLLENVPAQAQACTALRPIGGQGYEVRKRIDGRPGGVLVSNNWNTDFVVPSGVRFSYYAITITPENNADYDISIHFKYPNNTSDTLFQNGSVQMNRWQPWRLDLQSPTGRQPFQINTRIGGTNGNFYRVRVSACR